MIVICKKCKKEFELGDPTFIMLFNRKRDIYCMDCLFTNEGLMECNSCKSFVKVDGWGDYCSFHKGAIFDFYCEEYKEKGVENDEKTT